MENLHQTVKSFLKKYNLNNPDLVYTVAFSGGYDSMCLLHVLKKVTKNKIIALHLNHKWRGEESDIEEKNCKEFCASLEVEFYSESLSKEVPHTETAAREARYKFFEKCAKKFNSRIIFTAHNQNDNVETLLYRIAMGTGVSGLQGICEHRNIYYRPIININREEIENYCKKYKLSPNIDSSNSDTKYKRNLIRAKLLPALCEVNPNALEAVSTLIQVAKEETEIVEEYLQTVLNKISQDNKIDTIKYTKLSQALQNKLLHKIFLKYKLEYDRKKIIKLREFIIENQASKSGKTCSLTNNLWLFVNEKHIEILSKSDEKLPYFYVTKEGIYENNGYIFELESFTKPVRKFPPDSEAVAYVNLNHVPISFELRTRNDGDYIQPLGLKGTQKLKKYLNEKKLAKHEKDKVLFLCRENEVLWAVGLGISDKIKVTDKPTHRIKIYKTNETF